MKTKRLLSIALAGIGFAAFFAGCDEDDTPPVTEMCTVTFVMPNGSQQKVEVEKGGSLSSSQLPALNITGYTATWNGEFSNIESDRTVTFTKTANSYTVTYTTGDGVTLPDGTAETQSVTYDAEYTLATPNVPAGKYFWYWQNGTTVVNTKGDKWNIADNVTLTARVEDRMEGCYMVKFVGESGTEPVIHWVTAGEDHTAAFPTLPTTPGYDFSWDKTADDLKELSADVTVNLVKEPKTYTVTLDLNLTGAEIVGGKTLTATYGQTLTINVPTSPAASDMVFNGWIVQGTDTVFVAGQTDYLYTEGITLVAQWKEGDYWTPYY